MALKFEDAPTSTTRVIASADDAVDHDKSDWEGYKETLDESKLVMVEGKLPTVFVCNFNFDSRSAQLVENAAMSTRADDGKPAVAYGSWAQSVTRVALKDITNPDYMPDAQRLTMQKAGNGLVSDALLTKLVRAGVVDDIFSAYLVVTKTKKAPGDVKNS